MKDYHWYQDRWPSMTLNCYNSEFSRVFKVAAAVIAVIAVSKLASTIIESKATMQARTRVDTCTRWLIVWMQSALEPSASAADEGAEWCAGNSTRKRWAERRCSSLTAAVTRDMMNAGECRIAVVQPREDERRHQRLKNKSRHWPTDSPQLT